MPGMALHFLRNPAQRIATGKSMPTKQIEAVLRYGRPEQRAKVVERMLDSGLYALALHKSTQHILLSLLDHSDNLVRVRVLYVLRRKLLDLSQSAVGNTVVQHLLDRLPRRQRAEVAECFTRNVDALELVRLCEHAYGNHVAQKLVELPECVAVIEPTLRAHLSRLAAHVYGVRVVAKYMSVVDDGWRRTMAALCPDVDVNALLAHDDDDNNDDNDHNNSDNDAKTALSTAVDAAVATLFAPHDDSLVLDALLRHTRVPLALKDAIVAHACEYVCDYLTPRHTRQQQQQQQQQQATSTSTRSGKVFALPDFGNSSSAAAAVARTQTATATSKQGVVRHVHTYCTVLECGDDAQRALLWTALQSDMPHAQSPTPQRKSEATTTTTIATTTTTRLVRVYEQLLRQPATVAVLVAAVKHYPPCRHALFDALFAADDDDTTITHDNNNDNNNDSTSRRVLRVSDVARDAARTLLLRAFIDVDASRLTPAMRAELCDGGVARQLAQSATASPVLQKLLEVDGGSRDGGNGEDAGSCAAMLCRAVRGHLATLTHDACACFLVQALLQHVASDAARAALVRELLHGCDDGDDDDATAAAATTATKDTATLRDDNNNNDSRPRCACAFADLRDALSRAPASRVMQRLLAYASDDAVACVANRLLQRALTVTATATTTTTPDAQADDNNDDGNEDEGDNDNNNNNDNKTQAPSLSSSSRARKDDARSRHYAIESDAIVSYAMHQHACYVVQALLRETRQRQLEAPYKQLMQSLKPHVFDLAVSPWAGRVVLETMISVGSASLAQAMREVVFLRAEQWLSEAPGSANRRVVIAATRGAAAASSSSSARAASRDQRRRPQTTTTKTTTTNMATTNTMRRATKRPRPVDD